MKPPTCHDYYQFALDFDIFVKSVGDCNLLRQCVLIDELSGHTFIYPNLLGGIICVLENRHQHLPWLDAYRLTVLCNAFRKSHSRDSKMVSSYRKTLSADAFERAAWLIAAFENSQAGGDVSLLLSDPDALEDPEVCHWLAAIALLSKKWTRICEGYFGSAGWLKMIPAALLSKHGPTSSHISL